MKKWFVSYSSKLENCVVLTFDNYSQAYDYALSLAYLMFHPEFTCKEIKTYFDEHSGMRLGYDVVSLY